MKKITTFLFLLSIFVGYSQQWAFMKGSLNSTPPVPSSNVPSSPGGYDPGNAPANREHGHAAMSGNKIYLYGGANGGNGGVGSDLWVYDIDGTNANNWRYIDQYGGSPDRSVIGSESSSVHPGPLDRGATSADGQGNIWIFGGLVPGTITKDLWKYNTNTGFWTYYGGDIGGNTNWPDARYRVRSWFDASGNLWIFGGSGASGSYNDLWKFNPTTQSWTAINPTGSNNLPIYNSNQQHSNPNPSSNGSPTYSGSYNGVGNVGLPAARSEYGYWISNSGVLYIFAGYAVSHQTNLGDFWKYDPNQTSGGQWTLLGGDGTIGNSLPGTAPSERDGPYCWKDNDGKFHLFGGANTDGFIRDMWQYDPVANTWSQDGSGYNYNAGYNDGPSYQGTMAQDHPNNKPGAQICASSHITNGTHTYMLDGFGSGQTAGGWCTTGNGCGLTGMVNRYSLSNPCSTPSSPSLSSSVSSSCPGDEVVLTANGCSGGTIHWSNGSTGTSITVNSPGAYTAYCNVSGCVSSTASITISQSTSCGGGSTCSTLSWGANSTTTCNGQTSQSVSTTGSTNVEYSVDAGTTWHSSNGSNNEYAWTFTSTANNVDYLAREVGCTNQSYYLSGTLSGQSNSPITSSEPGLSASVSSSCPGDAVVLSASGCSGGTIHWSNGSTGASITVNNPGTYTAYCDISGCVSSNATLTISQSTNCGGGSTCSTLSWGPNTTVTCNGTTTQTVSTTGSSNVEYSTDGGSTWHVSNGSNNEYESSFTPTSNLIDYLAREVGCTNPSYYLSGSLTGQSNNPNTSSAPSLSSNVSSSCPGDAVVLTASGCSGGTIHWSNGSTGTSITVTNPGTYTAYCDVSGCVSSNATITINQSVSCNGGGGGCAALTWEQNELMTCNGVTTLTAYVTGGAVEFSTDNITWNAPNVGSTGYSWSFPAVNSCVSVWRRPVGCPDSTVWGCYWGVSGNPITSSAPSLASSVSSSCPGDAVVLTASGCSGGTVHWSNGSTGTSITVTNPGTYTAYCDMSGCISSNATITINQNTSCSGGGCPALTWEPNEVTTCNGVTTLTAYVSGGAVEFSTDNSTWNAPNIGSTGYSWSFPAVNSCVSIWRRPVGCPDSTVWGCYWGLSSNPITSSAPSLSSSVSSSCPGDAVVLTASGCSGGVVHWSNGSTGTSITVTNPGTYTAYCDMSGCVGPNATITINQSTSCGGGSSCATLDWSLNTTTTCNGITTQMVSTTGSSMVEYSTDGGATWNASTGSNNQYTWSFPATSNNIIYKAREVGCSNQTYYLSGALTGQSNNPITATAPSISSSVSSSCPGDAVVLTAAGCSGGAIQWSNNATGNSITITNPGTITAICTISGCSSSNGTITISQSASCGGGSGCATLSWGANTTITCSGTTTQTVSTTGSSSVEYSTDGGVTWHASTGSNNQYTWSFTASTNQTNYLARSVGCSDSQFYLAGTLAGQSNDCPTNSISDLSGTRILMNPNPASEVVTFQGLKTEKINHLRIVSISGKVIEVLEVIEDKMEVNVSRFEPGIYMVIFEGEDSRFTNKLIKN